MQAPFSRAVQFIKRAAIQNAQLSENAFAPVGWLGAIGHPLYWYFWTYVLPQPYESALLRLSVALMGVPLIFHAQMPPYLSKWMPLYWHLCMTFILPVTFTFLMLMNNFSGTYMTCAVMVLFLMRMFFFDLAILLICLIGGVLLAAAMFLLAAPQGFGLNFEPLIQNFPLFGFALISGIVCHHSVKKSIQLNQSRVDEKIKQQRLQALAGSIAHEMRNSLGMAKHSLDCIERACVAEAMSPTTSQQEATPALRELETVFGHLAQGQTAVRRGLQVITMTLNEVNARPIDASTFTYLSAEDVTRKALEEFNFESTSDRVRVSLHVLRDFTFRGDETIYVFILFNLIKNAVYYFKLHPKATITISVDNKTVTVKDTGPGIPADVLPDLFQNFKSSGKPEGTGLGLAYCRRAMQAFGGDITCRSAPAEYTEFVLHFPTVPHRELESDRQRQLKRAVPAFKGKHILVVDDQALLRNDAARKLKDLACEIDEAGNGQQAIDKLNAKRYDLVLMDLNMPIMDGYEAIEKIRSGEITRQRNVPILAYSSEAGYIGRVKMQKVGADGFLCKPCSQLQLVDAMRAAMAHASRRAGAQTEALMGKTLIVADDSSFNRRMLRAHLDVCKPIIHEAEHGQQVLDLLERLDTVHAILMDTNMPGMGGIDTTLAIRRGHVHSRVPIVAVTAEFSEESRQLALNAGMNAYVTKPVDPAELLYSLGSLLGSDPVAAPAYHAEPPVAPLQRHQDIYQELLDTERIESLIHLEMMSDLEECLKEMAHLYGQLPQLLRAGNLESLTFTLHSLLNAAGNAGARSLHRLIKDHIYPAIRGGQQPVDEKWLETVGDLLERTTHEIRSRYFQGQAD